MGAMLPSLRRCGTAALVLTALAGAVVSAGQLAGRPADEWTARLERPERIAALKIDYIIASLALKPGQNVADIGAGPGILSVPMAKAVGPGGKVYAVEIDKDYFPHVTKRAEADHVTNVVNVLGAFTDPKLPARDIDVALFHDVLHHIEDHGEIRQAERPDRDRRAAGDRLAQGRTEPDRHQGSGRTLDGRRGLFSGAGVRRAERGQVVRRVRAQVVS
jgi:SAM-dependent methyltransferase